jgi:hypothetical protein
LKKGAYKVKQAEIKRLFVLEFYGTMAAYKAARKNDYCKVQLEWSCFIDGLCRDGVISQAQYNSATF